MVPESLIFGLKFHPRKKSAETLMDKGFRIFLDQLEVRYTHSTLK